MIGQGLVGNFAAQIFQMAGADVMAVDLSDVRLAFRKLVVDPLRTLRRLPTVRRYMTA